MLEAVFSRGQITPLQPPPTDWQEGQRLVIEKADDKFSTVEEIDRDFAALEALCSTSEPAEEEQLARALDQARQQAKEQVRRQMGLS